MNVKELITKLLDFPMDMQVEYDYMGVGVNVSHLSILGDIVFIE